MKIKEADENGIKKSIEIASNLKEWFTIEGIKNMKIDFKINKLVTFIDKNKVIGFLCYSSENGLLKIIWMGVEEKYQNRKVGTKLINWAKSKAIKLGLRRIEVKTLTDKDKYPPYKLTREFYYKNGFKKVGYEKARVKGWDDQIIMEKIL